MKALITGISGQTGSYLAEYLIELGYEVHGMIRRQSTPEHQESRISGLDIQTYYGDVKDVSSIEKILKQVKPDLIFNLAAQSHVRISFDIPSETFQSNAVGVLNMLECYRNICPEARFYQASSSEMFGNGIDEDCFQRETTPMHPVSPYGIAKLAGYNFVRHYRYAYKLHCCNGILFNHESPRRASNFVTNKIIKTAVRIWQGKERELVLGNMDSYRDWGHAKDYAKAIYKIIMHPIADDFVISTGETHSIRYLCEFVFGKLGLDCNDFIKQDEKFMRPEELSYLKGDSSKARKILGWKPSYTFESMIDEMIEFWKTK